MYPYFGWSISLFLISLLLLFLFPRHRRFMILSGIFSLPFALFSIAFVPEYWNPVKIGGLIVGIEDILFSYATGCIVWVIASLISKQNFNFNTKLSTVLKRYLIVANSSIFLGILLWESGVNIMTATIILITIVGVVLLYYYRKLWFFLLSGAFGFTLFHMFIIYLILSFWPQFIFQWSSGSLSEIVVFGIPIEEIIWASAFGAVWPIFFVFIADLKLDDKKKIKN